MKQKCIFHIPYRLEPNENAAPMVRPRKIISALENIGYEVCVIEGYAAERKKKIKEVEKKIKQGIKYRFLYAESSTMPTLLTDPHHLPLHPLVDFSFFSFVKKHGIKIGLFYRDIFWKFDSYKEGLPRWKSFLAIQCYKYDIRKYCKLLDKIYFFSKEVYKYLNSYPLDEIVDVLPPGCDSAVWTGDSNESVKADLQKKNLNIFYVGGIEKHYQLEELLAAVSELKWCQLILCCREKEWEKMGDKWKKFLNKNIYVVHKSSHELEPFYSETDICSLIFKQNSYMKVTIPFKVFEYLAHGKPILASQGTVMGDFVANNDIGWVLAYDRNVIKKQLQELIDFPEKIAQKRDNCLRVREQNTWEVRAKKIERDLT